MYINIENKAIFYEKIGEGPALVMVHGNGEDHTIFKEATKILHKYFTVYLIDSPGHGKSDPEDSFSYEDMAEKIYQLLITLDVKDPYYFGFSDGGIIGLLIAINHKDYLKQLIISGANTDPSGAKDWVLNLFKVIYFFTKKETFKLMLTQPQISEEQLKSIITPTVVLAGSKDVVKESHTKMIAQTIPNSTLEILQGEDHGSYIIKSDKIAHLIIKHTKEVDA